MRDRDPMTDEPVLPPANELPSPRALRRSTLIAAIVAVVLLVTAVLPAEYDVDPTGIGALLGLKEIGEVKRDAVEEAAEAAAVEASRSATAAPASAPSAAPVAESGARADTVVVALHPDEGKEVKLVMRKGARVTYEWAADRGAVNFEAHGDTVGAPAGDFHSYKKGRDARADAGGFVAVFDGNHGWFWRNRTREVVVITLRTAGEYREVKRLD
jgi:hypothetical protein